MDFQWDDANLAEIDNHNLDPEEVEEAMRDRHRIGTEVYNTPTEKRRGLVGATLEDKVLRVVYTYRKGQVRVITAMPAAGWERERYWKQRGKRR